MVGMQQRHTPARLNAQLLQAARQPVGDVLHVLLGMVALRAEIAQEYAFSELCRF